MTGGSCSTSIGRSELTLAGPKARTPRTKTRASLVWTCPRLFGGGSGAPGGSNLDILVTRRAIRRAVESLRSLRALRHHRQHFRCRVPPRSAGADAGREPRNCSSTSASTIDNRCSFKPSGVIHCTTASSCTIFEMRRQARMTVEWFLFPIKRPISGKLMSVCLLAKYIAIPRARAIVRDFRDVWRSPALGRK